MSNSCLKLAKNYTKALIHSNDDMKFLESIISELQIVITILSGTKQLQDYLYSHWTSSKKKISIWRGISIDLNLNIRIQAFIEVLAHNHQLNILSSIVDCLKDIVYQRNGVIRATFIHAQAINTHKIKSLVKDFESLSQIKVVSKFICNQAIIGGLKIILYNYNGCDMQLLDLSYKHKINQLKTAFNILCK